MVIYRQELGDYQRLYQFRFLQRVLQVGGESYEGVMWVMVEYIFIILVQVSGFYELVIRGYRRFGLLGYFSFWFCWVGVFYFSDLEVLEVIFCCFIFNLLVLGMKAYFISYWRGVLYCFLQARVNGGFLVGKGFCLVFFMSEVFFQ